jgi:hypothetical protein
MARRAVLVAVAAALVAPAGAAAGGWATVGVDPLPEGIGPDEPWQVELTILQHGRTPLEGVRPRVIVSRGAAREVFPARATAKPGVYAAEVVFPSAGRWRYVVDDGFTMTHTFPPADVLAGGAVGRPVKSAAAGGGAPADASDGGLEVPLALMVAATGLALVVGGAALRRRRPPAAPEGG